MTNSDDDTHFTDNEPTTQQENTVTSQEEEPEEEPEAPTAVAPQPTPPRRRIPPLAQRVLRAGVTPPGDTLPKYSYDLIGHYVGFDAYQRLEVYARQYNTFRQLLARIRANNDRTTKVNINERLTHLTYQEKIFVDKHIYLQVTAASIEDPGCNQKVIPIVTVTKFELQDLAPSPTNFVVDSPQLARSTQPNQFADPTNSPYSFDI